MSDQNRPASRWSTSLSITTKSTGSTNQTAPLTQVRQKLFRQSENNQKKLSKRLTKSRNDIEELFRLYYSNDIKFDTFQRQIVTGTRIQTARSSPIHHNNPSTNSTNALQSKHCVSREQFETGPLPILKRSVQNRVEISPVTNVPVSSPIPNSSSPPPPPPVAIPLIQVQPEISPSTQHDELNDSSLVKSVAFIGDDFNQFQENIHTEPPKSNIHQLVSNTSKSSLLTLLPGPPPPSLLVMNNNNYNNRKDPSVLSHTSISTMNPIQQQNQPAIVTGSAIVVRQRSPTKQSWNKRRSKSSTTFSRISSAKPYTPSISSPLSIQSDMPELPIFIGTPRVVSIPSKCSRYVLVTFPEVPLRYNAPSYVERLLLPERFPTLFQNIVQSYDQHITNLPSNRNPK